MSSRTEPLTSRAHPRWGAICMLVSIVFFSVNSLTLKHLSQSDSATIGQLAMTEGFRHLTVAAGGAFQICVPVVIAIGGVTLFGESFTGAQLVGAAFIIAGCYWVMAVR